MTADNDFQAMNTQRSWMFLSSFEKLKEKMMLTETVNMAHLSARAFEEIGGEVVQITAFVRCINHVDGYKGTYCGLIEPTSQQGEEEMFLAGQNRYTENQDDFAKIPGKPVAYWTSEKVRDAFANNPAIDDVLETRSGMATTNNNLFLRCWFEISLSKCGLGDFTRQTAKQSKRKWFRYNKGGKFRRWFGNNDDVVNWENDGGYLKSYAAEQYGSYSKEIRSEDRYFDESITWSGVTSSQTGFRYSLQGAIFDSGANGLFAPKSKIIKYTLGFLNTKLVVDFVKCVNPTINTGSGTIGKLPLCIKNDSIEKVDFLVEDCIDESRTDWDSFETSRDFKKPPLV